jgi:hypothetical protein
MKNEELEGPFGQLLSFCILHSAFYLQISDVPQRQHDERDYQHQPRGHELFGFGQSHGEHDEQQRQQDVRDVGLEYDSHRAEAERSRKCRRQNERNLAFGFEKANQAADHEQKDINPKNGVGEIVHGQSLPQFACASKLRISPGSHSAITSNGRRQISQSVVNRWNGVEVSIAISNTCPQNGHRMDTEISTSHFTRAGRKRKRSPPGETAPKERGIYSASSLKFFILHSSFCIHKSLSCKSGSAAADF